MVGMKIVVKRGKTKDILRIKKVLYTEDKTKFQLHCTSLCSNTSVTVVMTANEVKNSLVQ